MLHNFFSYVAVHPKNVAVHPKNVAVHPKNVAVHPKNVALRQKKWLKIKALEVPKTYKTF